MFRYLMLLLFMSTTVYGCEKATMTTSADDNNKSACALPYEPKPGDASPKGTVQLSEEELKKRLTPEQYRVLRQHGTEAPFTGKYWNSKAHGAYVCAACGHELFESETKFDSGTGWPSFFRPAARESVKETKDTSYGMVRTEVSCSRCGSHLGHVFPDGPKPRGLRYCINSASLDLKEPQKK